MTDDIFTAWQLRVDAVWQNRTLTDDERTAQIDVLAAEIGETHPVALFERAGARDSAGREDEAEPLYRAAMAAGLDPERQTRAVIQLASTIRNLGKTEEALSMLAQEYERSRGTVMADEAAAFYALALSSAGFSDQGLSVALTALAPHLSRYQRSVLGYAGELITGRDAPSA